MGDKGKRDREKSKKQRVKEQATKASNKTEKQKRDVPSDGR
jgi:hypothetical protein